MTVLAAEVYKQNTIKGDYEMTVIGVNKTVLCCVVGMSPAVVTETLWALAHLKEPIIPDEIIVLTTVRGRQCIDEQLFTSVGRVKCGWEKLVAALGQAGLPVTGKLRFGLSHDCIRLFSDPSGSSDLDDITTTSENATAADFMLKTLREFTENPNLRLYTSIAGGRKTMSALMLSCMSLLGREQDHVLHVLVNEPFDKPVKPPFLFPGYCESHELGGQSFKSSKAKLELIDIPFVKMRGWYQDKFKTIPPSYSDLVSGVQKAAPPAVNHPLLKFDFASGVATADGEPIRLSPAEFLAMALLLNVEAFDEIPSRMMVYHQIRCTRPDWFCQFTESSRFSSIDDSSEELSKVLSSLRKKLQNHPRLSQVADQLCPKRCKLPRYPERWISADIQKLQNLLKSC